MARPKRISVRSRNAEFQQILAIKQNRQKRQAARAFWVEGVRSIDRVLLYGWTVRSILVSDSSGSPGSKGAPLSSWAKGVLQRSGAQSIYELTGELMAELSDKDEPSELCALIEMPPDDLARIPMRPGLRVVVLDRPGNPGNLGTILRSCDAFGIDGVILSGHAVDLYDPLTVRASVGSLFAIPAVRIAAHTELLPWFKRLKAELGLRILGSSARADLPIRGADLGPATALILGNETRGMSRAYRDLCDLTVTIPISGSATSLNVSCAAAVLLYEMSLRPRSVL